MSWDVARVLSRCRKGYKGSSDRNQTNIENAAIVDALKATGAGPVTAEDVSDEMTAWVAARLGAGDDLDGLIDEYIASQDS